MLGFTRKPLPKGQPSPKSSWAVGPRGLDAIVFVHGILGAHGSTWGRFFELLEDDEDLPLIDIYSWGYSTGYVPGSYQDVEVEGKALISEIETQVEEGNDIFLVAHSMGGLVVLKGLVDRIQDQHGQKHPVSQVRWI